MIRSRARSPARGRSYPVVPKDLDNLTAQALEDAILRWNLKEPLNRVEWNKNEIQWLQNGNVEVIFRPNTDQDSFDTVEFAGFIGAELGAPTSVRSKDGYLILVTENASVLEMQPQFKYRWKKRVARWLENIQWFLLWTGVFVLCVVVILLPFFLAPGYARAFFVGIWNFFRVGLLNFVQVIAGDPIT